MAVHFMIAMAQLITKTILIALRLQRQRYTEPVLQGIQALIKEVLCSPSPGGSMLTGKVSVRSVIRNGGGSQFLNRDGA